MKVLFLFYCIISLNISFSQWRIGKKEFSDLTFEVYDNHSDINYLSTGFNYDMFYSTPTMSSLFTLGLNGEVFTQRFGLQFDSRFHFADKFVSETNGDPTIFSIYKPEKSRDMSGVGTFFFYNKNITKYKRIVIARLNKRIYLVSKANVTSNHKIGLDIGFEAGQHYAYLGYYDELYKKETGELYQAYFNYQPVSSYHDFINISAGLNYSVVELFKVKTNKYEPVKTKNYTRFFIKGYYMAYSVLDDVLVTTDVYKDAQDVSGEQLLYSYSEVYTINHIKRKKFGFSLGIAGTDLFEGGSIGAMIEVGYKPRLIIPDIKQKLFFNIKLSFRIAKVTENH